MQMTMQAILSYPPPLQTQEWHIYCKVKFDGWLQLGYIFAGTSECDHAQPHPHAVYKWAEYHDQQVCKQVNITGYYYMDDRCELSSAL